MDIILAYVSRKSKGSKLDCVHRQIRSEKNLSFSFALSLHLPALISQYVGFILRQISQHD